MSQFHRRTTMLCLYTALFLAVLKVSLGQTVTVSMEPQFYSDPATGSATLTCEFSIDDATYTFSNLEWRTDGVLVADFFNGAVDPTYFNYCVSSGVCAITRTSSESYFTISSLDMTKNKATFSCQVTFGKGADRRNGQDSASLIVVVPPTPIVMLNGGSSDSFSDGSEVDLSLGVVSHIFQCEVPGINPQATFTWTVGGNQLSSDITENHVVDSGTSLTTSTSKATLTPDPSYNGVYLICEAKNYEGDPGVTFSLLLKVADPCAGAM